MSEMAVEPQPAPEPELWQLKRLVARRDCAVGELWGVGLRLARTLERGVQGDHQRIPVGTYQVVLKAVGSSKFDPSIAPLVGAGYAGMPELVGVPGRSEILIHTGNFVRDSLGCILVGTSVTLRGPDWTLNRSREAFKMIYPVLRDLVLGKGLALAVSEVELV